jgi:hypothetical protein
VVADRDHYPITAGGNLYFVEFDSETLTYTLNRHNPQTGALQRTEATGLPYGTNASEIVVAGDYVYHTTIFRTPATKTTVQPRDWPYASAISSGLPYNASVHRRKLDSRRETGEATSSELLLELTPDDPLTVRIRQIVGVGDKVFAVTDRWNAESDSFTRKVYLLYKSGEIWNFSRVYSKTYPIDGSQGTPGPVQGGEVGLYLQDYFEDRVRVSWLRATSLDPSVGDLDHEPSLLGDFDINSHARGSFLRAYVDDEGGTMFVGFARGVRQEDLWRTSDGWLVDLFLVNLETGRVEDSSTHDIALSLKLLQTSSSVQFLNVEAP